MNICGAPARSAPNSFRRMKKCETGQFGEFGRSGLSAVGVRCKRPRCKTKGGACITRYRRRLFHATGRLLFDGLELVLADTAQRAYPVVGNIFESRSGRNASFGIAYSGIIHPLADRTTILFHVSVTDIWLNRTNIESIFRKCKSGFRCFDFAPGNCRTKLSAGNRSRHALFFDGRRDSLKNMLSLSTWNNLRSVNRPCGRR